MMPVNRLNFLRTILSKANEAYHGLDNPIMPDHEYDSLLLELRDLEGSFESTDLPESPTNTVGGSISSRFKPHIHDRPMLSLSNAFSERDMRDFDLRASASLVSSGAITSPSALYTAEFKIDGLAVSLKYIGGKLVSASTRGDGKVGEDVTANILMISDIPRQLDQCPYAEVEVRGEVYMRKDVLASINETRKADGLDPLANVRNAAAGTLRQLDLDVVRERKLSFFPYTVVGHDDSLGDQSRSLAEVHRWGFPKASLSTSASNIDEIMEIINKWEEKRDGLDFEIDGIVVKVNSLRFHKILGATSKDPKWGIAYKFKPRAGRTRLLDIVVTVGRTGALTPNAVLEPVSIGGTRVSAATLHNLDYVAQKDIRIGDLVEVIRAGDVIPRVESVVFDARSGRETVWIPPTTCPACAGRIEWDEVEASGYRCQSTSCPAQIVERLRHFASRDAMDIDGFGDAVAIAWSKSISDLSMIYVDVEKQFDGLGFKGKQRSNLMAAIESSKNRGLGRVLYALGISNVGKKTAMDLARHFGTIDNLIASTTEELVSIDGIGSTVSHSIRTFFSDESNLEAIESLRNAGVLLKEQKTGIGSSLAGMTFVVTGTLPTMGRDEMTALIEMHGGKVSGSVSKKTTYLVAGESAGSKLEKAKKEGVTILSEDDLLLMVSGKS